MLLDGGSGAPGAARRVRGRPRAELPAAVPRAASVRRRVCKRASARVCGPGALADALYHQRTAAEAAPALRFAAGPMRGAARMSRRRSALGAPGPMGRVCRRAARRDAPTTPTPRSSCPAVPLLPPTSRVDWSPKFVAAIRAAPRSKLDENVRPRPAVFGVRLEGEAKAPGFKRRACARADRRAASCWARRPRPRL